MFVNEENKITFPASYFYNSYIDMYCVIGTTYSLADLDALYDLWESGDFLQEVPMPDYITEDYDEPAW